MAYNQHSYSGSVSLVRTTTKQYTASVQPARIKDYTASVSINIQPDRYYNAAVELVPPGSYIGHTGSVFAFFTPITPERFYGGDVVTVQSITNGEFYTASVVTAYVNTYLQTYRGSVEVGPPPVEISYTASIIVSDVAADRWYRASVVKVIYQTLQYSVDVLISPSVVTYYQASVVLKQFGIEKSYLSSVRPFIDISPGEHAVRDTDLGLLISLVSDRDLLLLQIPELTARLNYDIDEIVRLINILNEVNHKPSCMLSTIYPQTDVPRTSSILQLSGSEFVPTSQVTLWQGVLAIGLYDLYVTSKASGTVILPNFTAIPGINFNLPVSIKVLNADGEESETLTFTFASA